MPGHTRIPNRIGWTLPRPAKENFRITVAQHTFWNRPTLVHFLLATLTALNCHFLPSTCANSLFASPSEICHWNSSVWDTTSLTPPASPVDSLEDTSSQFSDSGIFSCDSMSSHSMDHSAYYSSTSPGTKVEHIPETDLYTTPGWTDGMFLPGAAPFSPVMSDSNQSAYTLPASDVSFPLLDPSISQDMPIMDACRPGSWIPEQPNYNVFAEPAVFDTEMFAFPAQGMDVPQPTFNAWYTPTDAPTETYLAMNIPGQDLTRMVPQTAGFLVHKMLQ
ncbi:hypothetical protein KCU87_g501, partial [Aureobasidium melanogenum]